jgi:uncharacterized protein
MTTLVLTSPETNAGKTTVAVALGQRLRRLGKSVSYRRLPGPGAEADARVVAEAVRLGEPPAALVPSLDELASSLASEADALLVEAGDAASAGAALRTPDAVPLVVARFAAAGLAEQIVEHARALGATAGYALINAVPEKGRRLVQQGIVPALQVAGLTVVGSMPQDRILLGMTVGDLARALDAEVLGAADQLDLPVEAVMISAMSDEGAEDYFRRRSRKAVVCSGDRPDIHMPALATDTSCIVLTEGYDPDPTIFETADEQGVPLLKVAPDTLSTLERISDALARDRFHQRHKVARAVALFEAGVDEDALLRALGIARREVA